MVDAIKVFGPQSKEYKKLQAAAILLNAEKEADDKAVFEVRDVYFDFGQGWMWTTIVLNGGDEWSSYQALNPAHQGMIVYGDFEDFAKAVWEVSEKRSDRHNMADSLRGKH